MQQPIARGAGPAWTKRGRTAARAGIPTGNRPFRYQSEHCDSVATATVNPSLTGVLPAEVGEAPKLSPKQRAIHPPLPTPEQVFHGGTSMSITTARQMARQAEEARRAAREHDYLVTALRREHLID